MTRTEQFSASVEQPLLQMKNEVENLNIDDLDDNQRLEFARAQKVLTYIQNYINLLVPDLLPQNFYTQMLSKIQSWNKTISHLNQVLDEILFILASYGSVYIPKNQVSNTINEMVKTYSTAIQQSFQEINFNKIKKDAKEIENYENQLLSADDSIQSQIANSQKQIQTWFNEIQRLRNNFFVKQDNSSISLETEIQNAKTTATSIVNDIEQKEKEFSQKKSELDEFYYKIFGNNEVEGLEQKLNDRQSQLDKYEKNQKAKIEELENQIKGLLGSATDASLAHSFRRAKNSYGLSICIWNGVFIISMVLIGFIAYGSIFGISFWIIDMQPSNINLDDYKSILNLMISRLPLYIPLGWLAIFVTRRRNEIKRLQEEYRHKEAAAKSYSGYKEQIKEVQDDKERDELIAKLMDNLVEMTSENPNKALDKTKKENIPMIEFFEKLAKSPEEARNLFKEFMSIFKKTN